MTTGLSFFLPFKYTFTDVYFYKSKKGGPFIEVFEQKFCNEIWVLPSQQFGHLMEEES
jgi:hypothetical protein